MTTRTRHRSVRAVALAVATAGVALLGQPPAGAHPFGPPPTALVSASGDRVLVEWAAAPDDAMVLGMSIGVLDDGSLERYLEGPVQTAVPAAAEEELSRSPALHDYLLERIVVTQGATPCDGTLDPVGNFIHEGATIAYHCPEPVAVVDLRITMLHDIHDSYRTFAITEGRGVPAQSVFTATSPEQRWDFAATTPVGGDRSWLALAAGALGAGGVGAVVVLAWRRRSGGQG